MDSSVRQINVVGGKPSDLIVKRRRTRRRGGGEEEEMDPVISTLSNPKITITKTDEVAQAPVPATKPIINVVEKALTPPTPNVTIINAEKPINVSQQQTSVNANASHSQQQTGGVTQVILKPKDRQTTKVLLKKKEKVPGVIKPKPVHKSKTRKLVLSSPSHRLVKTRHTIKHAKELPLPALRSILIEKKLIKPTSKAPEAILRQIYTDTLIVAKKTL